MKKYFILLSFLILFSTGLTLNVSAVELQGLEFDGVDDYIYIPHDSAVSPANEITIEMWVKNNFLDNATSSPTPYIRKQNEYILQTNPDGSFRPHIAIEGGSYMVEQSAPGVIKTGVWQHIAMTYDGTYLIGYVDGIEVVRKYAPGTIKRSTNGVYIGKWFNSVSGVNTELLNGKISEIRIWDYARSAEELKNNMNSNLNGSETGLTGFWKMTPYTSGVVCDLTSNGNDGVAHEFQTKAYGFRVVDKHAGYVKLSWNSSGNPASYVVTRDGMEIYRGADDTFVDEGVTNGASHSYALKVITPYGESKTVSLSETIEPANAIAFDGVDDYLRIPHSSSIDFGINDDFTLEFWVKADSNQLNTKHDHNFIIEKWSKEAGPYPFAFRYMNQTSSINGTLRLHRWNNTSSQVAISKSNLQDELWHHVAYVKRGNLIELYINGVLDVAAADLTTGDVRNAYDLFIAARGNYEDGFFKGSMHDLRIWNYARTSTEIKNNMYSKFTGSEAGLVGLWKMDGIHDGVVKDYAGGNDAIPYGFDHHSMKVEIKILPGTLSMIKPELRSGFDDVFLNGYVQKINASLNNISVIDARGTGEGWRVSVSASEFTELGGKSYKLPSGSLTLKSPNTVYGIDGTYSTVATIHSGPTAIDDGATHTIITANKGEALGSFIAEFPDDALTLTINPGLIVVDKETYPNSATPYESTLSWSIISGP